MAVKNRIFLAHASEDKSRVKQLYKNLKEKGFSPWLDSFDLVPGQNWREEIAKAIKNAAACLACLSKRSVAKEGYVQREFRYALTACADRPSGSIYLIPVRLDDCEVPDLQLPHLGQNLRDRQWVDLFESDGLRNLIRAIEQIEKSGRKLRLTAKPRQSLNIKRLDLFLDGDVEKPSTVGLNVQKQGGTTYVNLFSLSENEGQPLSKNIWSIAKHILDRMLLMEKIDDVQWTLTVGFRTTGLKFSTVNCRPYKLDFSDEWAIVREQQAFKYGSKDRLWSLDKYAENYSGVTPIKHTETHVIEQSLGKEPRTVFTIPCKHPNAEDGLFYCEPPYLNTPHMTDDFDYILVDTRKALERLALDDPDMLEHAKQKFHGDTPADWLEHMSLTGPITLGHWILKPKLGGLKMIAGQASTIELIQKLDLPYFPVTIDKKDGARELREQLGYTDIEHRPAFTKLNHS